MASLEGFGREKIFDNEPVGVGFGKLFDVQCAGEKWDSLELNSLRH